MFYRHFVCVHSLPFTSSLPIDLIKEAIGWWNQCFYFLFTNCSWFLHFLYRVDTYPYCGMGEYFIYVNAHVCIPSKSLFGSSMSFDQFIF